MTLIATSVAASWGPIMVAASDRGVVAVEFLADRDAFAAGLQRRLRQPIRWLDPGALGSADQPESADQPDSADQPESAGIHLRLAIEFLAGAESRVAPDGIPLDLDDRPAWDRAVLGAVRAIPRGETRSYGEIARAIGRPGAARAVGGAVGRNPIALIIPCHRVIAGDGTLGGYGGGWWGDRDRLLDLKTELLAREGRHVRRSASRRASGG